MIFGMHSQEDEMDNFKSSTNFLMPNTKELQENLDRTNLFRIIEQFKSGFVKIAKFVSVEGDFTSKVVSDCLLEIHHNKPRNESLSEVFISSLNDVHGAARTCLNLIAEFVETRKITYLAQLKKIRDTSNMSVRIATQNVRADAAVLARNLQMTLHRHSESLQQLQGRLDSAQFKNKELEDTVAALQATVVELRTNDQERIRLQNSAVAAALTNQLEQHRRETAELLRTQEEFKQKIFADASNLAQCSLAQVQTTFENQTRHETELRNLLTDDKSRLEKECQLLRDKLLETAAQVLREKDRLADRLGEERLRADAQLQEALSVGLKEQARLKADMAELALQMKRADDLRANELETKMARYRDSLLTAHALEVEKLHEKHRAEMKRYQAELAVRNQDTVMKMRSLHEQELSRVMRDNDKLRRMAGREAQHNETRPGPPHHGSAREELFASRASSSQRPRRPLHWGSLSDSIQHQEKASNEKEQPASSVPSSFPLDEAFESSKKGRSSGSGINIGTNAQRVGKYMGQLEQFLAQGHARQNSSDNESDSDDSLAHPSNPPQIYRGHNKFREHSDSVSDNIVVDLSLASESRSSLR